jgi:uncharacterized protein (TIGR03435 family)
MLIATAYEVPLADAETLVTGGPAWINSDSFNIEAKAERSNITEAELRAMMQTLLIDRFGLQLHREQRQVGGLALVVAEGGPRLSPSSDNGSSVPAGRMGGSPMIARNVSMSGLARVLAVRLRRPVVDATNLRGRYNFTLTWTVGDNEVGPFDRLNLPPEVRARMGGAGPADGPSLETALREQLGLRLQAQRVPQDILVIDRVNRPTPN